MLSPLRREKAPTIATAINIEREMEERSKEITTKNKQSRLRAIILQGATYKSLILLSLFGENEQLANTIMFSHFGLNYFLSI